MTSLSPATRLSRRQVVQGVGTVGFGLLAGCGRWPGQAQAPARIPRVGVLWTADPSMVSFFHQGLRELGYVENQNILLEHRFPDGRAERLPELAAELAQIPVDVLVTSGLPGVRAAQQATGTIPIVMAAIGDAVGSGFVSSLAQPGGNTTGLSFLNAELSVKQLELLRDTVPGITRVMVLRDASSPATSFPAVEAAAPALGLALQFLDVQGVADFDRVTATVRDAAAEALLVLTSAFFTTQRQRLIDIAAGNRLPAMYPQREFVESGGLVAYGVNLSDLYRRAATYVDKILKGANPTDLPVEQPMRFDLVINLGTAQALGLTIPPHVLLQATEVIQ